MFCDKDFADGANAARSSGSAAVAIAGIVTAVTAAGKKHAGNSVGQQTSATEKLWKQDWIKETASELIDDASQNIPLWIKVHSKGHLHTKSSPWCFLKRLAPGNAANQHLKPERFTITGSPAASSAGDPAVL